MSGNSKPSVLSSLFIDFDNIYLCLRNKGNRSAQAFVAYPQTWLEWLDEHLESITGLSRRILVKRCYMNPESFGGFRSAFLQCGFEVIECPPLTKSGKTGADIRIAVDMLELADFQTLYKEFILLSADADFTPVMLKLRKSDRRTIALAVGDSSPIYRASCSAVANQDDFIKVLTSSSLIEEAPAIKINGEPLPKAVSLPEIESPQCLTDKERKAIAKQVTDYVRASATAVPLTEMATQMRQIKSDLGPGWAGEKTFKKFLQSLNPAGLIVSTVSPGYVYAPDLHTPPISKPTPAKTSVNKV